MSTVAIKERPILFSGPMVRAILEGRKTQTRRILKPKPERMPGNEWHWWPCANIRMMIEIEPFLAGPDPTVAGSFCPYGAPGERLWVRETFFTDRRDKGVVVYDATPEWGKYRYPMEVIRSTHPDGSLTTREDSRAAMLPKFWTKRPSIHMPRWASRLTLEIVGVRVERLKDISEQDALAEGSPLQSGAFYHATWYRGLWESINGEGSWDANPWVWVIEFRKVADQ